MRTTYLTYPDGRPYLWSDDDGRTLRAADEAATWPCGRRGLGSELMEWLEAMGPRDASMLPEQITSDARKALGSSRLARLHKMGMTGSLVTPTSTRMRPSTGQRRARGADVVAAPDRVAAPVAEAEREPHAVAAPPATAAKGFAGVLGPLFQRIRGSW